MENKYSLMEKNFSWYELAHLYADLIEEENPNLDDYNRNSFINWFMKREKLGLRFDHNLTYRAYYAWKRITHKYTDHFLLIVGSEGTGKSTLAEQFCSWVSPDFSYQHFIYNADQYKERLDKSHSAAFTEGYLKLLNDPNIDAEQLKEISKGMNILKKEELKKEKYTKLSYQIDEGGISLYSRDAMSGDVKYMNKTFMTQRILNLNVVICIPNYWDIDKGVRRRISTLIHINEKRKYKAIVGTGIDWVNDDKNSKKKLNRIAIKYGDFWQGGYDLKFTNNVDRRVYELLKIKYSGEQHSTAGSNTGEIRAGVTIKRAAAELCVSITTLRNSIQEGTIKAIKMGQKYVIPYEEYDLLKKKGFAPVGSALNTKKSMGVLCV